VHDPGKVLLDLTVSIALGGDCLADLAVVRAQGDLGHVASDPTVSRLIDRLAVDADIALNRPRAARAGAARRPGRTGCRSRRRAWCQWTSMAAWCWLTA